MLQSLANSRFAVPFLMLLATGGISVLAGAVAVAWPRLHPIDTETERATYFAGVGLAAIGGASIALGFRYAGTMAALISYNGADNAGSPTFIGGIGQALPWTGIALMLGVVGVVALLGAIGTSVYTQVASGN